MNVNATNRSRVFRVLAVPFLVGSSFGIGASAMAESPLALTASVTDSTSSVDTSSLESKLAALQDSSGNSLRIVIVDTFDGASSDTWAHKTFQESGMGRADALIALATEGRQVSVWAGGDGWSADQLTDALNSSDVLSAFREDEWADGLATAVANLDDARSVSSNSRTALIGGMAVLGAGAVGSAMVVSRRRKKKVEASRAEDLATLSKRASEQLLTTDEGVRSAAAELEFARVQFGLEATKEFDVVLKKAQGEVEQAFAIRRELDDNIPETPEQQRTMNTQIIDLTTSAQQSMAAQQKAFGKLRNLVANVGTRLGELEERAGEIAGQRAVLVATIDHLAVTHSETAVATLRTYPDQIETLVANAREQIASGRKRVNAGKNSEAVAFARIAEDALSHAANRVEAVMNADANLADIANKVRAGIASISSDVADAERLGGSDPAISAAKARAKQAIAAHSGSGIDPFLALSELTNAENELDNALAGVRAEEENRKREAIAADRNRSTAISIINQVDEQILSYRPQIKPKTLSLAASTRDLVAKGDAAGTVTAQADFYKAALSMAERAQRAVESDVDEMRSSVSFGSQNYGNQRSGPSTGGLLAGMILGSILSNSNHHHYNNDFGGSFGGFDGGFDFGGFSGGDGGGFSF